MKHPIFILHELLIDSTYLRKVVMYQFGSNEVIKHTLSYFDCSRHHPHYLFYTAEEKAFAIKLAVLDTIRFDGEFLYKDIS